MTDTLKPSSILLRTCQNEDIEKVAIVLEGSGLAKDIETARKLFQDEIAIKDTYIIAENEKNEPLGITTWRKHGEKRHGLIELYHIGVRRESQLQGIAQELFYQLEKDVKEYFMQETLKETTKETRYYLRKLFLFTHDNNVSAHNLYKKVGMECEAKIPKHFSDTRAELVFAKYFEKPQNENI